jgi:hypothetical protein
MIGYILISFVSLIIGRVQGRVNGFTAALVPLTTDADLEDTYRHALGVLTASQQKDFDAMLQRARDRSEERDTFFRWFGDTLTRPIPVPVQVAAEVDTWPGTLPQLPLPESAAAGAASREYILLPGYKWPVKTGPSGVAWAFHPRDIDVSSGEPIVRTADGYWVWGRGCTQPGGGIAPAWGFVRR